MSDQRKESNSDQDKNEKRRKLLKKAVKAKDIKTNMRSRVLRHIANEAARSIM